MGPHPSFPATHPCVLAADNHIETTMCLNTCTSISKKNVVTTSVITLTYYDKPFVNVFKML